MIILDELAIKIHPPFPLKLLHLSAKGKNKEEPPELPHLHPVAIHLLEEYAEGVRLGGHITVQQVGAGHRELHLSDAVLRANGRARVGP